MYQVDTILPYTAVLGLNFRPGFQGFCSNITAILAIYNIKYSNAIASRYSDITDSRSWWLESTDSTVRNTHLL
jgi:hypothetical protein